jgi:hypothetical protein
MRVRVSKRLSTGVSTKRIKLVSCHLFKHGVRKICHISPRWNPHTSPWRTTCTTKGRPWPMLLWDHTQCKAWQKKKYEAGIKRGMNWTFPMNKLFLDQSNGMKC